MAAIFVLRDSMSDKDIELVNARLKANGCDHCFVTQKMYQGWVDDINTNPTSPQRHLRPKTDLGEECDITIEELRAIFDSSWATKIGAMSVDADYSRMWAAEARLIVETMSAEPLLLSIIGSADTGKLFRLAKEAGCDRAHIDALTPLVEVEKEPGINQNCIEQIQVTASDYAERIIQKYENGHENAYEAFRNSYGDSFVGRNDDDLSYIRRCAMADFKNCAAGNAVFQDVYNELVNGSALATDQAMLAPLP